MTDQTGHHPSIDHSASDHSQDDVFAFLGRASTYGGVAVRRIDTHAGIVFLAGERALKVKRAVRFPFLDFSTLAKRKAACLAEIEANRPFAPELYRGVIAVTRGPDGTLALGGDGEPVEWAVDMRRFDETKTLDRLADAGRDRSRNGGRARAQRRGRPCAGTRSRRCAAGSPRSPITSSRTTLRSANIPRCFRKDAVANFTTASRAAFARLRPLLMARGEAGLVRRGHGDLHLGNIALIEGRPVPFDALEFDPVVASGDVLYDLAFLLMDLVERKLEPAANVVLNRYLTETRRREDLDALAALPFLMSMRAAIRAKVTAARAAVAPAADRAATERSATTYFELATALIAPPPPRLVAVGGLSGTGKSLLARALAPDLLPHPGAVVLRSDVERKALFGVAETDRLPAEAYTPEITAQTYAVLADKARRTIAAGHSAIVDAVFSDTAERDAVAAVARTQRRRVRRPLSHRRSRDADCADRPSHRRRLRRRRRGRPAAGGLCAGLARLEHGRRVRHAGGDARAGEARPGIS